MQYRFENVAWKHTRPFQDNLKFNETYTPVKQDLSVKIAKQDLSVKITSNLSGQCYHEENKNTARIPSRTLFGMTVATPQNCQREKQCHSEI